MKCQNCGRNEVNFHYSSNVNGAVTETRLCSECARKSGYDFDGMFDMGSLLGEFFPALGMRDSGMGAYGLWNGYMQNPMSMFAPSPLFPFASQPRIALRPIGYRVVQPETKPDAKQEECACGGECAAPAEGTEQTAEVDAEMKKRCEINAIREQMRMAAAKEDFEKAAELRDRIKGMEA